MNYRGYGLLLLAAILIRGGMLLAMPDGLHHDPDGYRRLAENLREHGTFGDGNAPTAYRPPLFPVLLAGCLSFGTGPVAVGVLHGILGAATVALTFLLARWWGLGNGGAALAAFLVACDPILLNQSTQVMTETTAAFLAVAGLAALTGFARRPTAGRAISAGIVLGLGALCRPAFLPWAILVGVALAAFTFRRNERSDDPNISQESTASGRSLRPYSLPLAFALGVLLVLGPWAVRNQIQFGRPIVTTTHGGFTLLLANNPDFFEWLHAGQWGDVWKADQFNADWERRKPNDEIQADRLAYAEAWKTIHNDPGAFFHACLVRIGRFWSPLPHQVVAEETLPRKASRFGVAIWYVSEYLLVAMALLCKPVASRDRLSSFIARTSFPWLCGILLVAVLSLMHTFYWTDMRMRAPLVPLIALAAARVTRFVSR